MEKNLTGHYFPPGFDVAPLVVYDIRLLGEISEQLKGFVIALASAYNDLKDTNWVHYVLSEGRPPDPEKISPQHGQWNGMVNFVIRQHVGRLFEIFELIQRNRDVLNQDIVKDVELLMGAAYLDEWKQLKAISINPDKRAVTIEKKIWLACKDIRDSISHHYYGVKNFSDGFDKYCEARGTEAKVYVSLGDSMEGTRFHFADAATQNYYDDVFRRYGVTHDEVLDYVRTVNWSIRSFLDVFLSVVSGKVALNRARRRELVRKKRLESKRRGIN